MVEYDTCSVCMETPDDSNAFTTPCQHVFHKACLDQWFEVCREAYREQSCPMCRREIPEVLDEMSDADRNMYLEYADTLGVQIAYERQQILLASSILESLISNPVRAITGVDITGSSELLEQNIDRSLANGNDLFAVESNASRGKSILAILSIVVISIFGAVFSNRLANNPRATN